MKHIGTIAILLMLMTAILCACGTPNSQGDGKLPDNTNSITESEVDTTEINTDYGVIRYPKCWDDMVNTDITKTEDGLYCVTFYGTIENHDALKLFDVIFGGDNGTIVGHVEKDGEIIDVYVISYDPEFDDTWSQQDRNTVVSMQEDINVLIKCINN